MKRLITGLLVAACAALLVVAVLGPAAPVKAAKQPVKGEEYHHLLMLDVKESVEHAKTLNYYAEKHAMKLDKAVMTKHVDELTKNLDGVHKNLTDLEQNVDPAEKAKMDAHLATIRTESEKAQGDLDLLKAELAKDAPSASVITTNAKAIYVAMSAAEGAHKKAMAKHGVVEPKKPATTTP